MSARVQDSFNHRSFFLPRPEAYSKADVNPQTKKILDIGISGQELPGNAKNNDGFYEKGILQAMESDRQSLSNAPEVKAIGNGHCHCQSCHLFVHFLLNTFAIVTENCRRVKGVWNCFGGGGYVSSVLRSP